MVGTPGRFTHETAGISVGLHGVSVESSLISMDCPRASLDRASTRFHGVSTDIYGDAMEIARGDSRNLHG